MKDIYELDEMGVSRCNNRQSHLWKPNIVGWNLEVYF
jgi:hypothetical protein